MTRKCTLKVSRFCSSETNLGSIHIYCRRPDRHGFPRLMCQGYKKKGMINDASFLSSTIMGHHSAQPHSLYNLKHCKSLLNPSCVCKEDKNSIFLWIGREPMTKTPWLSFEIEAAKLNSKSSFQWNDKTNENQNQHWNT